jgi:hypothetical protein
METGARRVQVRCFRYDPAVDRVPRYQMYEVPLDGPAS